MSFFGSSGLFGRQPSLPKGRCFVNKLSDTSWQNPASARRPPSHNQNHVLKRTQCRLHLKKTHKSIHSNKCHWRRSWTHKKNESPSPHVPSTAGLSAEQCHEAYSHWANREHWTLLFSKKNVSDCLMFWLVLRVSVHQTWPGFDRFVVDTFRDVSVVFLEW